MAIVKMKRLRLFALSDDRGAILNDLQRFGCVEVSETRDRLSDPEWAGLTHPDESGALALQAQLDEVTTALDVLSTYCPKKTPFLTPRPEIRETELFDQAAMDSALNIASVISDNSRQISQLFAQENKLNSSLASLRPWEPLDVALDIRSTQDLYINFCVCPSATDPEEVRARLAAEAPASELIISSSDREQHYMLFVCHRSEEEAATEILKSFGFSNATFKGMTGTAKQNIADIEAQLRDVDGRRAAHVAAICQYGDAHSDLKICIDRLTQDRDRELTRDRLLATDRTFFLEGWVTAPDLDKLRLLLSKYDCAVEFSDPAEGDDVPVKLKNNKLTEPLNMVTEMYSLPAYDGLDPNPLMAPFFILFYGIMMADMGYGLIMMIAGALVLKKKKPTGTMKHLFGLMFYGGISTFIWGAVTGGFFGDAPYRIALLFDPDTSFTGLPALFNPLDDTLMVLIGSLILGFIQVITGTIISFVAKVRSGHLMDGIWDEGTWWVIFAGIGLMVLGVGSVGGVPVVLCIGILMLVVGSGRNAKGFGKVTAVFGEVYNGVTGYFSDILSYSRLMALMLAGSVIAQVFNTLGAIPGNLLVFTLVFIVGQALNFGLNLLGCYVHDLRLQCLEYFGRFYKDGGRAFKPLSINTKYVSVINKEDN